MFLNEKVTNYKVVDLLEYYKFSLGNFATKVISKFQKNNFKYFAQAAEYKQTVNVNIFILMIFLSLLLL